ncbi:MAG: 2-amino-4-hydroxy-6-hydroxymethyldihydropteridine diphosphokinase [Candidatus Scalindua sp.]|nr:2-amino-4-hydroxy-6-hydroxymethyldihydropteridine diphosphokinase [Candidatus Scalindua sp.]
MAESKANVILHHSPASIEAAECVVHQLRFESRTIDLDLLLYGDHIIEEGDMNIPDQDIYTKSW